MVKNVPFKVKQENLQFYNITQRAYFFGAISHFAAIFVFLSIPVKEMALFNAVISVPVFLLVIYLNRMGKHNVAFAFAFFELFFHQVIGLYYMGWGSGLQFWFIYLAGLSFFNPHWSNKVHFLLLFLICSAYLLTYFVFYQGFYLLDDIIVKYAYLGGAIVVIAVLSLLINHYSRSTHKAERGLTEANNELNEKNRKINKQNEQIVQSINYAERIQKAVIPETEILSGFIDEYFLCFKPKDIVSGDFYWFSVVDGKLVLVCADCTGHGVPGGFMSMLGMSFLNELVNHRKITQPAVILENMRSGVKEALQQTNVRNKQKEGMDMSICVIEKDKRTMYFAGANNGVFLVRNNTLYEHKPTKNPIGTYIKEVPFKEEKVELQAGDRLYLITDGYIDQFGGNEGKKYMKKQFKEDILEMSTKTMEQQKAELENNFENWKGDFQQTDDCTVIGLKID